jgi:hypothetical protein
MECLMSVKWLVQKDSLEIVVDLLENVPTRNGIKSSEFIKVSKLGKDAATFHLASTLYGKGILHTGEKFPFEQDLFLDRRLFFPFIKGGKESKSSDYLFIGSDTQLIVKHGNRRAVYTNALPISGYEEPNLDKANSSPIQKRWVAMIDCAANAATDDPITPTLNAVYLTQTDKYIEVLASNQRLVFMGRVVSKKPLKGSIAFPLGLVQTLKQESAIKLFWTNKLACVEFPKGKVWQAVKTAARKSFPAADIRKMVKGLLHDKQLCSIPSSAFAKACNRLSDYTSALDDLDLALEIYLTKGSKKILLSAGVKDSKFTEQIYAIAEAKQDKVLEWPLSAVMPIILFNKDEGNFRIHLSDKGVSCLATKNIALLIGARSK